MKDERDLLAVGHTAFDYIIQITEFPEPNSATTINRMRTFFGGAAANVAVTASKIGLRTSLISAVGGDFLESDYQAQLKNLDVNITPLIIIEEEKTPTAFVLTDANDDQIFYFYWGAATHFKNSEPSQKAIKNVKAVHLATGDPSFNWKCGQIAREEDKLISFDPGQDLHMYSREELKNVIGICDILFGNHHEIERILETLKMEISDLREFGPDIVVKTLGKKGSVIYSPEKIKIKAIKRMPVDPTGAGDSYRAGFLRAYLKGENLQNCGKFASSLSSFIVEAEGCQTNIPDYHMVLRRMENNHLM